MRNKLVASLPFLLIATVLGLWTVHMVRNLVALELEWQVGLGLMVFLMFYAVVAQVFKLLKRGANAFNQHLEETSIEKLIGGFGGLMAGALLGLVSCYPLSMLRGFGSYLTIAVFIMSGIIGWKIGRRTTDMAGPLPITRAKNTDSLVAASGYKVVDTSAIIDGRIYDVCLSHFLEGSLIVPTFVIEELQHIADSSDNIRRNKGRRGLELLSKMQKHPAIKIDIIEGNELDDKEVDTKLIRLCKQINASIITNDYNLNKVAELQGITVLNINELTNAVKVIVYPGETMHITIIKEGKEPGQGIGYLEDGTMVVVEDASSEINNDIEVTVTSVFQTAAGRMIFTRKIKEDSGIGIGQGFHDVQEVNLYG
ncbi:MAG TPA: twitching motility protein PilT [Syntrophomonas sp.]|jgi:uncharacterized protein YacL|nr:twitching motility protein PilT [Syntrophomonas sp.]